MQDRECTNGEANTPKNQNLKNNNNNNNNIGSSGWSVVPQLSMRSSSKKGEPSLRHKSILKVMALSSKSCSNQAAPPTESTPRSLININMAVGIEEPTPTTAGSGSGGVEYRNRSKSLDNPYENSFYNTCYLTSDHMTVRTINNQTKSESMNLLKTRLDYFFDHNCQNSSSSNNNRDEDDYSKNNLILSYENNLTPLPPATATATIVAAAHIAVNDNYCADDDACFLNLAVEDDDDDDAAIAAAGTIKTSYNYNHHNSLLDTNKTFNNLNKSVTSLYNRLRQHFNVSATVQPTDTLGYLKMYTYSQNFFFIHKTKQKNIMNI